MNERPTVPLSLQAAQTLLHIIRQVVPQSAEGKVLLGQAQAELERGVAAFIVEPKPPRAERRRRQKGAAA